MRTVAVLLALALAATGCGGKEERKAMHLEKGKTYFAQANYDKAKVEFKNVLQIEPKTVEALYMIGLIDEEEQDWRGAFGSYLKATELDPGYIDAKVKLGRLYLLSGSVAEAEKIAEDVLSRKPGDAGGLFLHAGVMARKGNVSGAIAEATAAVAADPTQVDAVSLLAGLYARQGDDAKAADVLERGLKANQKSLPLHQDYAAVLMRLNEPAKAEAVYAQMVAIEPQSFRNRAALANFYIRTRQLDKAEKTLRDAAQAAPEDDERQLALVEFLANHRGPDVAEKELLSAIGAQPRSYPLRFTLAKLYDMIGSQDKRDATYRDIIASAKTTPDGLKARTLLARSALASGDAGQAEKLVAEVLKENPKDDDALQIHAQLALSKGDAKQSISDLRAVLRDRPDSVEVLTALAAAHSANNEQQLGRDVFNNAIVRYPKNVDLRVALARYLASSKDYEGALKEVNGALDVDPNNVRAYELKADIESAKGDVRAAEATLGKLKATLPAEPAGYYRLGLLYLGQKNYGRAAVEFESALQKSPGAIEPLTGVVNILVDQGKTKEAIARVNQSLSAVPGNPLAYALLANVYARSKMYSEAAATLQKLIDINPRVPGPYVQLAKLHMDQRNFAAAVETLQKGLTVSPGQRSLSLVLAETYQRAGQNDKAIAEYERVLKENPGLDAAANNLAVLLIDAKGDRASTERALELSKKFENSSNPSFVDTLGWAYFKLDQNERALPLLQKAAELAPNEPTFQYHLGMAMYKKGDTQSAKLHLKQAIDAKVDFPGRSQATSLLAKL